MEYLVNTDQCKNTDQIIHHLLLQGMSGQQASLVAPQMQLAHTTSMRINSARQRPITSEFLSALEKELTL